MMKIQVALSLVVSFSALTATADEWVELFNGKDLTGWSPLIDKVEPGTDPAGHVVVRDGAIHMYADTPAGTKVPFGTIIHERKFSRFHLSLEYQWGKVKFPPRLDALRDAGLLYHIVDPPRAAFGVWPESVECQIQEGDVGDIVSINSKFLTWLNPEPEKAPAGQGTPGMLPEMGGVPALCGKGKYIGRYPECDHLEGWNTVEAIVQADETAIHKINGVIRSRLSLLDDSQDQRLGLGKIGLQLEGAEISYRKVRIRELPEPLKVPASYVSMSAVHGISSRSAEIPVSNISKEPVPLELKLSGKDADSFSVETPSSASLEANGKATLKVAFKPTGKAGRYSAGLQIGPEETGTFVILQGLALDALEGENEPSLERIAQSLGIPLDVGGPSLSHDTEGAILGASKPALAFQKLGERPVTLTALARFSPPGEYTFGWQASGDASDEKVLGNLTDSSKIPDAHQRLFPPLTNGAAKVEFTPGEGPFGLFVKMGKITVATDLKQHPGIIANPVRVFPITCLQGRRLTHALLICFEEAKNGDYQDSVFLMENARIVDAL